MMFHINKGILNIEKFKKNSSFSQVNSTSKRGVLMWVTKSQKFKARVELLVH